MDAEAPPTRPRRWWPIVLLAAAVVRRFMHLGRESLWLDEAASLRITDTLARLGLGNGIFFSAWPRPHPFLYYSVLDVWTSVFGESEVALRSLSAVFGIVLVLVTFWAGKKLVSETAGLVAAVLLLVNPVAVYYAQEARMYTMVSLAMLLSSVFFYRLCRSPDGKTLFGYVLSTTVLLYTDYLGILLVGGQFLFSLGWLSSTRKLSELRGVAWGLFIAFLLYIPWLPNALGSQKWGWIAWMEAPDAARGLKVAADVFGATLGRLDQLDRLDTVGLMLVAVLGGLTGVWLLATGLRTCAKSRTSFARLVGILCFIPLLIFLISVWIVPIFNVRQVFVYFPMIALVMAMGWEHLTRHIAGGRAASSVPRVTRVAFLGLLLLNLAGVLRIYLTDTKDDWRQVAADVESLGRDTRIVISEPFMTSPFGYYYRGSAPVAPVEAEELTAFLQAAPDTSLTLVLSHTERASGIEVADIFAAAQQVFEPVRDVEYRGVRVAVLHRRGVR